MIGYVQCAPGSVSRTVVIAALESATSSVSRITHLTKTSSVSFHEPLPVISDEKYVGTISRSAVSLL